jgi:hypothetical protein
LELSEMDSKLIMRISRLPFNIYFTHVKRKILKLTAKKSNTLTLWLKLVVVKNLVVLCNFKYKYYSKKYTLKNNSDKLLYLWKVILSWFLCCLAVAKLSLVNNKSLASYRHTYLTWYAFKIYTIHYMLHREEIYHYTSIPHGFPVTWDVITKASA